MKVIKKDGRLQELDISKIKVSISNASNGEKALLNESDINILVEDIIKIIENIRGKDSNTSSYEIIGAVIEVFKRDGFDDVISSYIGYKKD